MATASSGPCWSDLNNDLLSEISHHLHDAADYVRFHAVCKSWRASLRPPASRQAFLPWLLGYHDVRTGYRKAHYVFASTGRRVRHVRNRGWALAPDDGVAAYHLLPAGGADEPDNYGPLGAARSAASVALPPYPDEMQSWPVGTTSGTVAGDGTVFLCAFRVLNQVWPTRPVHISMAFLRPGDASWTFRESTIDPRDRDPVHKPPVENCSVAYHDGKIVQCWTEANSSRNYWTIGSANSVSTTRFQGSISESLERSRGYLLESRGELLWVLVYGRLPYDDVLWLDILSRRSNDDNSPYNDDGIVAGSVAVSVYVLRHEQGGAPQWVRMSDAGRCLADRALFLGWQGSFAVDVARFGNGAVDGGCAYFVHHKLWHCVFKYNFIEDRTDIVEDLRPTSHLRYIYDFRFKWIMPNQPTIASTQEIQEKLIREQERRMQQSFFHDLW